MKTLVLIAGIVLLFSGCIKNNQACTPKSPDSEEAQIKAYATANNINAIKHPSGVYYEILTAGTGATPTVNSRVFITYTGKLLNNQQFDQQMDPSKTGWALSTLIEGWQIGVPLIKKGGKIKLIIPSSYAYGCNDIPGIPGNSVLFFEISLVDVQ